jgi:hypothetical protein
MEDIKYAQYLGYFTNKPKFVVLSELTKHHRSNFLRDIQLYCVENGVLKRKEVRKCFIKEIKPEFLNIDPLLYQEEHYTQIDISKTT